MQHVLMLWHTIPYCPLLTVGWEMGGTEIFTNWPGQSESIEYNSVKLHIQSLTIKPRVQ